MIVEQQTINAVPVNIRKLAKFLLPMVAVLIMVGCEDEVPMPAVEGPKHSPVSYVHRGRYQGVASSNQFAVWVVDTQTGAVVRCDMDACGEWVVPQALGTAPASEVQNLGSYETLVPESASQK